MKHNGTLRRGLGILLSLVMCLGLLPATALAEETETGKAIQIGTLQIKGGQASSVYLGNYRQSSDGINGYNTDPIKWRVLSNADGKLFLLAGQNLDAQQYNSSHTSITWEKSTIRSWLNGYGENENTYKTDYSSDNFIDAAFSKEEQGAIAETFVYNATQSDGSSSPNPKYDIPGGNNTTDKIFLLSIEEANNSSYFPNGNDSRKSINTAYVASRHTNMHGAGEADFWRLRSPGFNDKMAALVTDKGGVYYDGGDVDFTYDAVRPAFNLNLNSVLFTSAAEGGKSASGMGSGLASVGDYTGNEWKLTLLDSDRSGFTASTETVADNKVTIAYSNATTGSNEYISAIVQDADGSVPYYGRIAQLDGTTNTASGTVEIDLSGINMTGKTLCVFNEQYNGDKMTDYASALCTLSLSKPISGCTVDPISNQTYNGTPQTPAVTVRDGDVPLTKDTDYTVFYKDNVNAGTATVTITGMGDYTGKTTATFTILQADPIPPTDLTGIKGKTVSTVRLPSGWWWDDPAAILNASGFFKVRYRDETGNYNDVSDVNVKVTLVEGYTVTAYGLYGTTMGIEPGETYTEIFAAGEMVGLQIGKRDGYKLKDVTLVGITEDDLSWSAKDQEINDRGFHFSMPENDVTVTVNWEKTSGSSSGGSGGGSSSPSYSVTVDKTVNGTVTVSPKSASKGSTVTLTVTPDKGYTLETLTVTNASGKEVKLTEKNGKYTFTMPGSKVTVKATFMEDNSMLNFFVDVPADAYYYDAVLWAAENGITGGVDDTHFAPNAPCTRAQIVTFLWRAAGSPEPESVSSFADVPADSYYAKAVAWAVENGITTGTGDGMFSPNATCTRAQAMAFIWRSQKSVAADGVNPFTDVAADAYYADAVLWAVENGVTNGTSDTTFSPNNDCTRAQIVTFLFRCLGEE
ncbi:S-layer homology domain-containing protein [Pseudoflavonifractor phocaeensis]|uniref:S-layer homology domain-containing protein n=1 Tax=Pseudoflavonifractor phocaeensis TaxID=1870988 RepID=UPI001F44862E|nr:S-layer homology domain-containing protein [Pseudoflavonifractor phocaeensis]MCF2662025.1 S-layer homology domain-containing protein [Pseudoflavonifractor phocaeensis]